MTFRCLACAANALRICHCSAGGHAKGTRNVHLMTSVDFAMCNRGVLSEGITFRAVFCWIEMEGPVSPHEVEGVMGKGLCAICAGA